MMTYAVVCDGKQGKTVLTAGAAQEDVILA